MKQLFFLVLALVLVTGAGAQVQAFNFKDNTFPWSVNIGKGTASTTHPAAFLEVGGDNSKKGFLMPRGSKDSVQNPTAGLLFFDVPTQKVWVFAGGYWQQVGSTLTAAMIRGYFSAGAGIGYDPATGVISNTRPAMDTSGKWIWNQTGVAQNGGFWLSNTGTATPFRLLAPNVGANTPVLAIGGTSGVFNFYPNGLFRLPTLVPGAIANDTSTSTINFQTSYSAGAPFYFRAKNISNGQFFRFGDADGDAVSFWGLHNRIDLGMLSFQGFVTAPGGANGQMYYNTTANRFEMYESGVSSLSHQADHGH